jgi:ABC-type antimicrobial peptide transport system permease subunit
VDPDQPVYEVLTMQEVIDRSVANRRLNLLLLGTFAVIALVLAAAGLYGVISYLVAQRTRELGIRMALGAARPSVLALVVGQGMALAGLGVAIGLVSAFAVTRFLSSQLFGVGATDPSTFVGVSLLLVGVAFLASLLPAMRATRVDPVAALRDE